MIQVAHYPSTVCTNNVEYKLDVVHEFFGVWNLGT